MELIVVRNPSQLFELIEYLADKDYVAFDTETDGLTRESHIIGFSVCAEPNKAFYAVLYEWVEGKLVETPLLSCAYDLLKCLYHKQLITHNGVFDCSMVQNNFNLHLMPSVMFDTMVAAHLLNENRSCKLKDLGALVDDSAKDAHDLVRESVLKNGGKFSDNGEKEFYKADSEILATYGAKDTILTFRLYELFGHQLLQENLFGFFCEESMPLFRGPTYDLNTVGIKVDMDRIQHLKATLETEIAELQAEITNEIKPLVKDEYPGTSIATTFNPGSSQQLAWLLCHKLGNDFTRLTDLGKEIQKKFRLDYLATHKARRDFINTLTAKKGQEWSKGGVRPRIVNDYWTYICMDEDALSEYQDKHRWVKKLLQLKKSTKLLSTYVNGIIDRLQYGVIYPSFVQIGTTSGRYSSREPNFQNLPREDKRVKACMVPRAGHVFVGADQSQLEPRVFASLSKDVALMACFASGDDFYSVVGAPVFNKYDCSLVKDAPGSFSVMYPKLRQKSKVIALATPYGQTASFQAQQMGITKAEAEETINAYFEAYPSVRNMMLESHAMIKRDGVVYSMFGRPRRVPAAKDIDKVYGRGNLPYEARTMLNLSVNHQIQSTAASIVNRSMVRFQALCKEHGVGAKIIIQVHDSVVAECKEEDAAVVAGLLRTAMEDTTVLPGVKLEAVPKIGNNLGDV